MSAAVGSATECPPRVVLVTGGNGYLGGHIVNALLQEKTGLLKGTVGEIRVFDRTSRTPDHALWQEAVQTIEGDITDAKAVQAACCGVDVVIHCAAVVSEKWQAGELMERVNVGGTRNILEACMADCGGRGPRIFIHAGSVTAAMTREANVQTAEDQPLPDSADVVSGHYGRTKNLADSLVRSYNSQQAMDGRVLHTCILRLLPLYGEGDCNNVCQAISMAKKLCGIFMPVGDSSVLSQYIYAGNAGYAFVFALAAMLARPDEVRGKVYYICDDTKAQPFGDFIAPFLTACGCRVASISLPWPLAYLTACISEASMQCLSKFVDLSRLSMALTKRNMNIIRCSRVFSDAKARQELGYDPPYSVQKSLDRSLPYYRNMFT